MTGHDWVVLILLSVGAIGAGTGTRGLLGMWKWGPNRDDIRYARIGVGLVVFSASGLFVALDGMAVAADLLGRLVSP